MRHHMKRNQLALLVMGLAPSLFLGCEQRREALGGGALAPVRVTLLVDGANDGDSNGETAVANTPKIEGFGTFRGQVLVTGEVPVLAPLVAQGAPVKDAICAQEAVPNELAVVSPSGGLANVFVFLRKVPNVDVPPPPADEITVDQKGCRFIPHAFICRVGQPIRLLNSDPVAHNVGLSGAVMSFNQTLGANDTTGLQIQYERAERLPVKARCDFHGWMQAFQLPLDHPWGAVTDADGAFEITGVPAGPMEFTIWHEKAGYIERVLKVDVPVDGTAEVALEVAGSKLVAP